MKNLLVILIILFAVPVFAAEDYYQFTNPKQEAQFSALTSELRCLVCQNQNLAESNAALAVDLRKQIYQQINQGQSNKAIIDYLVARYGSFILYKPPFNAATLGLWLGPILLLIVGLSYLFFYLQKHRNQG